MEGESLLRHHKVTLCTSEVGAGMGLNDKEELPCINCCS